MNQSVFPLLMEADYTLPFYMTSAGGWNNQEPIDRPNGFVDYQWLQCVHGEGVLRIDGKEPLRVGAGQGMLLMPNECHTYYPIRSPWSVRWIGFRGHRVHDVLRDLGLAQSEVLYHTNPDETLRKIAEASMLMQSDQSRRAADCSALVYDILMDLYKYASRSEIHARQRNLEQLAPLFQYIDAHYQEPLTLDQLAATLSVTAQHTCLLFQTALGLRPFEYLTRFRLSKAKEWLIKEPQMPIKEIANQVGYEHPSYFIKLFRQQEGLTPSQFRNVYYNRTSLRVTRQRLQED